MVNVVKPREMVLVSVKVAVSTVVSWTLKPIHSINWLKLTMDWPQFPTVKRLFRPLSTSCRKRLWEVRYSISSLRELKSEFESKRESEVTGATVVSILCGYEMENLNLFSSLRILFRITKKLCICTRLLLMEKWLNRQIESTAVSLLFHVFVYIGKRYPI